MISKELESTLNVALKEAKTRRHEYVCLEHLLYALLQDKDASRAIINCGGDIDRLRDGHLHAKRQLVLRNARQCFGIAESIVMVAIQICGGIYGPPSQFPIHAPRIGQVQNRFALRAALDPLVHRRQE